MAIATRQVSYNDGETSLNGVLTWDEGVAGRRPGILLIHGGAGLDDHAKGQALRYAGLGYVVLACDMLGEGVAGDRERVVACLTALREDPARLLRRAEAGLEALARRSQVGPAIAAVGFCFGGMTALTLARSGADLTAVVSMHGSLASPMTTQPGAVRARVLVCHGASDPHVPLADLVTFAEEMTTARADWQLLMFGGAVHGFTHVHAMPGATPGVEYHAAADERSFAAARIFLTDAFAGAM